MQLELTRAELEWLLFNVEHQQATLPKGRSGFDVIWDETALGLFKKLWTVEPVR
jgi:hypothetical protein